jgi:hypothetical protein
MILKSPTTQVEEKFHLNQVRLAGAVQRIWSAGADVMIRLVTPEGERFLLTLPGGAVNGQPVTLMKDDPISVAGYLVELPYLETGRQFLERVDRQDLLADIPGLAEATDKRMTTCIVVESLEIGSTEPVNEVLIEGIVSRAWEKGDQRFARLAIYDEHTVTEGEGRKGRPRRIAHYVSVHFPDGQVTGRQVVLSQKDHLRVIGRLSERRYSESLGYFLMRAGAIGVLAEAPNADEIRDIRVSRVATYVVAESMLQFTK